MQDEFEDKDKENVKLMKDIGEVKDQNEKLQSSVEQQQKETERLKVCELYILLIISHISVGIYIKCTHKKTRCPIYC